MMSLSSAGSIPCPCAVAISAPLLPTPPSIQNPRRSRKPEEKIWARQREEKTIGQKGRVFGGLTAKKLIIIKESSGNRERWVVGRRSLQLRKAKGPRCHLYVDLFRLSLSLSLSLTMRTTAGDRISGTSTPSNIPFRGFSALNLRHHQVASLELSSEEELHHLRLFHSRLSESLQSLIPSPAPLTLSLPFLFKLLDALLFCESDFKSLFLLVLSRNPSFISRSPLDRAVSDLLVLALKALDICNAAFASLQSLRHLSRHAKIAASSLHRPFLPHQINRAQKALSKLFLYARDRLSSSSSTCRGMCRICLAKRHLHAMAASLPAPHSRDSGSPAGLGLVVQAISSLLYFTMWVMLVAFPCGGGLMHPAPLPLPAARHMPWALALTELHERIVKEMKREWKEGGVLVSVGMLSETLALERSGMEIMDTASNGEATEAATAELVAASQKLEEGLGPFERKVREVFHRLVRCREEVLRCLDEGNHSSAAPIDPL